MFGNYEKHVYLVMIPADLGQFKFIVLAFAAFSSKDSSRLIQMWSAIAGDTKQ